MINSGPIFIISLPIVNSPVGVSFTVFKDVPTPLSRYKQPSFNQGNYFSCINNVTPAIPRVPLDATRTLKARLVSLSTSLLQWLPCCQ